MLEKILLPFHLEFQKFSKNKNEMKHKLSSENNSSMVLFFIQNKANIITSLLIGSSWMWKKYS